MADRSEAPACPRCGHPDEPGRWCNWCGAWLGAPLRVEDSLALAPPRAGNQQRGDAPRSAAQTEPVGGDVPASTTGDASPTDPATPTEPDRERGGQSWAAEPTPAPDTTAADRPTTPATLHGRRTTLLVAVAMVAALAVVPRLLPDAPRQAMPRFQPTGLVDLAEPLWLFEQVFHRPSRYADQPGPFDIAPADSNVAIRIDDLVIEVDQTVGVVLDRAVAPPDASTEPQVVAGESVRIVDPVGGDILRVLELPQDWYVLDDRERGGRILVARVDPSGLSPFDSLAALDLVSGRLFVFEAEAPQALVAGTLTPEGTRIALVREFDRNGLYLDIEREALSIGQIRLPTPESVVDADSLHLDAAGSTVAVGYERSFPGRPVATTLHVRSDGGPVWDAEIPGGTPIVDVRLHLDGDQATVFVRRADNHVSAWVNGQQRWTVDGPPRLVPTYEVVAGPVDATVLARMSDVLPWKLVTRSGTITSTPVQGTDDPVAVEGGFTWSRQDDLRAVDVRGEDLLDRDVPVRGRVRAGHATTVVGDFRAGCGAVCVVDLFSHDLLLRTTEFDGRNARWFLGPRHVAAERAAPPPQVATDAPGGGVRVVRIEDGVLTADVADARLVGPADDDHVVVELTGDDGPRLGWLHLDGGTVASVGVPTATMGRHGAFSGSTAVVPTALGLARVDRGGVRWVSELAGLTSPPVVVGDHVIVARARQLLRLALEDGTTLGATSEDLLPGIAWWVVPAGRVLFVGGDGYVAAFPIAASGG